MKYWSVVRILSISALQNPVGTPVDLYSSNTLNGDINERDLNMQLNNYKKLFSIFLSELYHFCNLTKAFSEPAQFWIMEYNNVCRRKGYHVQNGLLYLTSLKPSHAEAELCQLWVWLSEPKFCIYIPLKSSWMVLKKEINYRKLNILWNRMACKIPMFLEKLYYCDLAAVFWYHKSSFISTFVQVLLLVAKVGAKLPTLYGAMIKLWSTKETIHWYRNWIGSFDCLKSPGKERKQHV